MNISRQERRILQMLAQGGYIQLERDARKKLISASFISREGWHMSDADAQCWKKLRARRLIQTHGQGIYRISRSGLLALQTR